MFCKLARQYRCCCFAFLCWFFFFRWRTPSRRYQHTHTLGSQPPPNLYRIAAITSTSVWTQVSTQNVANARRPDGARRPGQSVVRSRDPLPPGDRLLATPQWPAGRTPDTAARSRLLVSRMYVRVHRTDSSGRKSVTHVMTFDLTGVHSVPRHVGCPTNH